MTDLLPRTGKLHEAFLLEIQRRDIYIRFTLTLHTDMTKLLFLKIKQALFLFPGPNFLYFVK